MPSSINVHIILVVYDSAYFFLSLTVTLASGRDDSKFGRRE